MDRSQSDGELLAEYAGGSQAAFAEVVSRHSDFVYSAALRQTRDPHLAEDVTQAVFILLSQKAGKLQREAQLMGWLHNVARYAAANALRQQRRREHHERSAARVESAASQAAWESVAPAIDAALAKLGGKDRDAVLLRYFGGKSHKQIAEAIGVSEAAAKMRIGRALEKLRSILGRQNLTLTAAAIEQLVREHSILPTPRGLAERMADPNFVQSVDPGVKAITQGANQMMMWTKLKFAAAICLAVALLTGAAMALVNDKPEATPPPAAARPAAPPLTPPAADDKQPRDVIIAAFEAATTGDEENFIGYFTDLAPAEEATLKQIVNGMSAAQEVQKAIGDKFGAEAAGKVKATLGVTAADLTHAEETILDDQAIVNMGDAGPGKVELVKTDKGWKIAPEVLRKLNPGMVAQLEKKSPQLKKLAADISEGKFKSVQEVQQAMAKLMSPPRL